MDKKEIKQRLVAVRATFNTIGIVGTNNMEKILGCAQIIQEILNSVDSEKESQ